MYRTLTALLAVTAVALSGPALAQSIGIGTGAQGSTTNSVGAALAKVAADHGGLNTRAVPHSSNAQHIYLVDQGQLQFGINTIADINDAVAGTREFTGRKFNDWRIVGRLFPFTVSVVVRKDSDIKTMKDLEGKTMPSGFTAMVGAAVSAEAMLANGAVDGSTFKTVPVPNVAKSIELFVQGDVDGIYTGLGGSLLKRLDAEAGGIRILSLDDSPEALAKLEQKYPNGYLVDLKPGTTGVEGPTKVMAQDLYLMSSTHMSDDVVYKLVKSLAEHQDDLAAAAPILRNMDVKLMAKPITGLEFHPGAMRYYKEAGIAAN